MVFLALLLTLWEIQIEGKDDWAAKAPGWRLEKRWGVKFTVGRPLTGYHGLSDLVLKKYNPPAVVLCLMELAVRMSSDGILCGNGLH